MEAALLVAARGRWQEGEEAAKREFVARRLLLGAEAEAGISGRWGSGMASAAAAQQVVGSAGCVPSVMWAIARPAVMWASSEGPGTVPPPGGASIPQTTQGTCCVAAATLCLLVSILSKRWCSLFSLLHQRELAIMNP